MDIGDYIEADLGRNQEYWKVQCVCGVWWLCVVDVCGVWTTGVSVLYECWVVLWSGN